MGAVAVCGIAAVTLTGTLGLADALSGFSHSVIWLVVTAFFISAMAWSYFFFHR